ncbi:MAG: sterol desaturase family protein [Actinomycetia bacterium]|nr:sterol desaturase family protein [Actinomycetes bacterium]
MWTPEGTDEPTVTAAHGPTAPRPAPVADLGEAFKLYSRHTSVRALGVSALLAWTARLFMGKPTSRDFTAAVGVLAWWPLNEWLAHKLILHARPITIGGRTHDPHVARYHRAHHADPWRIDLSFLPAWFILPALPVNVAVWWIITGRRKKPTATGVAAISTMALVYEWTHYLTHTSHKPRHAFYRKLQRRHRLHHFKHEQLWYGFTVPWVDDLLGTAPDPSMVETSPDVRTLGVESSPAHGQAQVADPASSALI